MWFLFLLLLLLVFVFPYFLLDILIGLWQGTEYQAIYEKSRFTRNSNRRSYRVCDHTDSLFIYFALKNLENDGLFNVHTGHTVVYLLIGKGIVYDRGTSTVTGSKEKFYYIIDIVWNKRDNIYDVNSQLMMTT